MNARKLSITVGLFILLFFPIVVLSLFAYTVFHQIIVLLSVFIDAWAAYYLGNLVSERERLSRDVFMQVYELKKVKEALDSCQASDEKTQVYNERLLGSRLAEECERSRRYQRPFSCLLVGIDSFSTLVQHYGKVRASVVVHEVAQFLKENTRSVDIIIRQGEERFVAILPETRANQARIAAERIRYAIEKNVFRIEAETIKVTVSIGIVCFDHAIHRTKEDVLNSLEKALQIAQKSGANRIAALADVME